MANYSPYITRLCISAFGIWPWQLVPIALVGLLLSSFALRGTLFWSRRKTAQSNELALLEPGSPLRAAIEQLRVELESLTRISPPNAVRIVEQLLSTSMLIEASDVHLSPLPRGLSVSIRVHGVVYNIDSLGSEASSLVANRLKVLASLDLHTRHVPQDGRLVMKLGGRTLEARISTLPTENGERIVLRLVEGARSIPGLSGLGFSPDTESGFAGLLARPQGLIFVTGPVGSGKSTTLYAGLSHIAQTRGDTTTIVTLEDPIELRIPFATQTQVNHRTNLTFASVLRSVLRQDPNVLMVGEIRDRETADIAMQAGLTGHLLLTTIHADDAMGPFARLIELGIDPFSLANSVIGCLSQRLVRRLCQSCRSVQIPLGPALERLTKLGIDPKQYAFFESIGCPNCDQQGYVGRCTISELLIVDSDLKQELHGGLPVQTMRQNAIARGMIPLLEDGLRLAVAGDIGLSELLRVAG